MKRVYVMTMKKPIPSFWACAVVAGSSLIWISGITLALVRFLELSSTAGWVIAISLGISTMLTIAIIFYEMMHAIDLKDHEEFEEIPTNNPWEIPYLRNRELSPATVSGS